MYHFAITLLHWLLLIFPLDSASTDLQTDLPASTLWPTATPILNTTVKVVFTTFKWYFYHPPPFNGFLLQQKWNPNPWLSLSGLLSLCHLILSSFSYSGACLPCLLMPQAPWTLLFRGTEFFPAIRPLHTLSIFFWNALSLAPPLPSPFLG